MAGLKAALVSFAVLLAGCDVVTSACGEDLSEEPPVAYSEGTVVDATYRSSSWDSESWVDFPPGLIIEFEHQLGAEPRLLQVYVAASREDGVLVQASGEEAEIVAVDSEVIALRNPSCADLFVVVTAQ
jgi:hypothetical protein